MPRGDQLSRQWKIIQALSSSGRGTTAARLAEEVECTLRTVSRDLEALQAAGFPVYNERDDDGRSLWQLRDKQRHIAHIRPRSLRIWFNLACKYTVSLCQIRSNHIKNPAISG